MAHTHSDTRGIAKRYVKALLELAEETRKLDVLAAEFTAFETKLGEIAMLRRLLEGTALPRKTQTAAIVSILTQAKADPLFIQFAGAVGEARRLRLLPAMIRMYLAELAERRGEVAAEVITATPLDTLLEKEVKQAIQHIANSDKIALTKSVDASLLGGLIIRMQSRMLDTSLRTKLKRLETALIGGD